MRGKKRRRTPIQRKTGSVQEGFELAAAAANSAIYDWDLETGSVNWTDAITSLFGYRAEEIEPIDQWRIERIHPSDRDATLKQITAELKSGRNFSIEYRFRDAHNNYKSVVDTGLLIRNSAGKVVRVIGSLLDVTEQKRGEKQLRQSEQQYRLLFESNPSPMWVVDIPTFAFLAVNDAAIKHYGYSRGEFLKMTSLDIRPAEDIPRLKELTKKYAEDREASRQPSGWRHRKKDGTLINVQVFSQHLMFQGKSARLVLINDVTETRQTHETLELLTEVTITVNETDDLHEMIALCLERICKIKKWSIGQAWFVDSERNYLFCSHSFYSDLDVLDFRQESLHTNLTTGIQLPGKVWQTGEPVWMGDMRAEVNERSAALIRHGLKSGFAFPIHRQNHELLTILEFYAPSINRPDAIFMETVTKLSDHLAIAFDRKKEHERIRYQATHDPLTGLPNRLLFQDRFAQAIAHAARKEQMLAILMLDLDNFKSINDTMGHAIGDQLLQAVAHRLSKRMREVDTIARMGGDELIMLLPDLQHLEDAAKVAQRVLHTFDDHFSIEGKELRMTTSVGISIYPHDGENSQTLLKNVDIALYRAKEKGRNNYQLFTPSMTASALARMSMEKSLRQALEKNEFVLYYQPQFDLTTGQPVAMEALLRWQHPEMGLCLPAEFLPLSEETGVIGPIWEWSLANACEQLKQWQQAGTRISMTMNIPGSQLQIGTLVQTVFAILNRCKVDTNLIELEIAETLAKKEMFILTVVNELKSLGVRVALDDYGTGYSSLSYLKEIPIDVIKIDPYFIRGIHSDPADEAIVRSIIALARGLKMRVVAEGVETGAQIEALRALGCDSIQGFLACRPSPADKITQLLESGQLRL